MSGLEGKEAANGEPMAEQEPAVEVKISTGQAHEPSQETKDKAEALKVEGNTLLNGKKRRDTSWHILAGSSDLYHTWPYADGWLYPEYDVHGVVSRSDRKLISGIVPVADGTEVLSSNPSLRTFFATFLVAADGRMRCQDPHGSAPVTVPLMDRNEVTSGRLQSASRPPRPAANARLLHQLPAVVMRFFPLGFGVAA